MDHLKYIMGPLERIKLLQQNTPYNSSLAICPSYPLLEEENKDATSTAMPEGFLQADNDLQVKPPLSMTCLATSRVCLIWLPAHRHLQETLC